MDTGSPPGDGGGGTDAPRDSGGMSVCDSARTFTLTVGDQHLTGNTTGMGTSLARADGCGGMGTMAGDSPQEVIALTLPGTASDMVGVLLSTAVTGTDPMFDTVVEVRLACDSAANAVCIDDTGDGEYRSTGTFLAEGGSTVFMIVRGYVPPYMDYLDVGAWEMDLHTFLNPGPPTFTSGDATLFSNTELLMHITAADPAGSGQGVRYSFLDATGTAIGFDLDADPATPDDVELFADFTPSVLGMMTFTSEFDIFGFDDFPQSAMATQMRVSVVNAFDLESAEATFPIVTGTLVGLAAVCDATHRCTETLTCTAGVCVAAPEVVTACASATALTIATPTTTTTSATAVATLDISEGALEGSCIGRGGLGDEALFTVTVPATGAFDLIVDTNGLMIGETDTLVYDRTSCAAPSTETGCNDDDTRLPETDPPLLASYLEILDAAPGAHTVVIDSYETLTDGATVDVTVSLRPVLATGTACDPMGVMNRCAAGTCPATGSLCP